MRQVTDIIVIGGGVIGLTSAWFLHKQGLNVTVIDRGFMGLEASWAAGGILSSLQPWNEPASILELAAYSQEHYSAFCYELMENSGIDAEWQKSGLFISDSDNFEYIDIWLKEQMINFQNASITNNCSDNEFSNALISGLLLPDIAQVKPPALLLSLKSALSFSQVRLQENTQVIEILSQDGKIKGVKSEKGTLLSNMVLICTGAWSNKLVTNLDIKPIKGQMLSIKPSDLWDLKHILLEEGRYLIPRLDGSFLVGSTLEDVGFDHSISEQAKLELFGWAKKYLPKLNDEHINKQWSGLRSKPTNNFPIIDEFPEIKGLYISSGHYRNGILLALGSARIITDLVVGKKTFMSTTDFAL